MPMGMVELLADFVAESIDRFANVSWLYAEEMQLYVRKGRHYIEGKKCVTLDLASFEIYKKGQGTWSAFVREAHATHPWDATYVECVHNVRLAKWLERHGFHKETDSEPGNYFLWKHEAVIK